MGDAGWTRTTCPYCGVGCGILAQPRADGTAEIKGDPEHPANFGRLCSKGAALGETMGMRGRLTAPMVGEREASWDEALDHVARRFAETIDRHGRDSVAFYVSGQLLTEDYYAANKLMKGYIGSANIDTNSRLCMASSVAGHKRAFGSDTVPGTYEDLELADVVVLVGSNLAWCHPVLFQRLAAARETRGTKVVVVDPRRTATCEIADLHLQIAPGSDGALFNGLLAHLDEAGRVDRTFVARHTTGFEAAIDSARATGPDEIAAIADIPRSSLDTFYNLFAATDRIVTVYSQGINQSSSGTDKVNAIINCHLATGRIGRPGMGPLSVTGQPNAMGGREVGGLANMLAAHMDIANPEHRQIVQTFWGSPRIATTQGLKAVDLFQAVGDGRIKAIWIMATNPVVSLPDADGVRRALASCPFVVVSDVVQDTDTTAFAHVRLPSLAWGEKDGTVTNSERRISRQRSFVSGPALARADWWQMAEVAKRLGHRTGFSWDSVSDIFGEHARLSGAANAGTRDFDISAYGDIDTARYRDLSPFQWPAREGAGIESSRFFSDGNFYHSDRKARFLPTPIRPVATPTSPERPFVLNTGRVRDQWHTMTRTGRAPRLMTHTPEPFIAAHPDDVAAADAVDGDLVAVESAHGRMVARLVRSETQRRGELFAPIHWSDQFASQARVDALIAPITDPFSGQPESKATPVSLKKLDARWHAFGFSQRCLDLDGFTYRAIAPTYGGFRFEASDDRRPEDWEKLVRHVLGFAGEETAEVLAYHDASTGQHRFAVFDGNTLTGGFFASQMPVDVTRTWMLNQLGKPVAPAVRFQLLAGRPAGEIRDRGRIVCACFDVGRNDIIDAIVGGCRTVAAVGASVKAGTNCGSCRSEIGRLIHEADLAQAG